MSKIMDPFKPGELEALCRVLADTNEGLTGKEIEHFLGQARVKDISPSITKWQRLYNALALHQNDYQTGKCVLNFIVHTMAPARYRGKHHVFEDRRAKLNEVLSFHGLEFKEDGTFARHNVSRTLNEAEARVERLKTKLENRGTHPDVFKYCDVLLHHNNYFHAVLEASKSIADKIRQRSGVTGDGAVLIDGAFGGSAPILRINSFATKTEEDEQKGFVNLLKGLFGMFRNPTAHAAQISWKMSEDDALDLFAIVSYAHRRIDRCT